MVARAADTLPRVVEPAADEQNVADFQLKSPAESRRFAYDETDEAVIYSGLSDDDFYLGSLDEDSFKEALEEFSKDSKAIVITNTAKKYIRSEDQQNLTIVSPNLSSRRFLRKNSTVSSSKNQIDDLRRFSLRKDSPSRSSRSSKSSPISGRRFSLRTASPSSKSTGSSLSSGQRSGQRKRSPRSHLVKRKVKTPDGKKKTEYAF
ncbi:unnamed protein product, partial [Nesidiocoris tenuis]